MSRHRAADPKPPSSVLLSDCSDVIDATVISDLSSLFPRLAVSTPERSLLDLPAELRIMVYTHLSPYSQATPADFGRPMYLDLSCACRQHRQEVTPEIRRVAELYFRAYEADWLKEHGEVIRVKEGETWRQANVVIGNATEAGREKVQSLPLLELPFSLVSITLSSANHTFTDADQMFAMSQLIARSTVKARRIVMVCWQSGKSVEFDSDGDLIFKSWVDVKDGQSRANGEPSLHESNTMRQKRRGASAEVMVSSTETQLRWSSHAYVRVWA
jgi:hypothetical protein